MWKYSVQARLEEGRGFVEEIRISPGPQPDGLDLGPAGVEGQVNVDEVEGFAGGIFDAPRLDTGQEPWYNLTRYLYLVKRYCMSATTTPRDPQRRARILGAAARLISHYGYSKTTIEDIARAAGVSKGAVYLHWPSKVELFDELLVFEMRRTLADFWARVQADPLGGQIGPMYRHAVLAMQANPLVCALYTQESRVLGDYMQRRGSARYTQRFLFGQDMIRQMQAAGLVRAELDPEVVAYLMSVIAYGFIGIESVVPAEQAPGMEVVAPGLAEAAQRAFGAEGGDSQAGKQALATMMALIEQQYQQEA